MKKLVYILLISFGCTPSEQQNILFNAKEIDANEWETYEGRWMTEIGILEIELTLNTSTNNVDTKYQLLEKLLSNQKATSTMSNGRFIFFKDVSNNEIGLCLQNLTINSTGGHFRVKKESHLALAEEMYFISRGPDELIPTDENFKPITTDRKYSLHKRKGYFTIEGYISFDSTQNFFFERNTMQRWSVADLGEIDSVKLFYKNKILNPHESLYLKALAYVVTDTTTINKQSLVIKSIKAIGEE